MLGLLEDLERGPIVGMVQSTGDWWLDTRGCTRAELVTELTDLLLGAYGTA